MCKEKSGQSAPWYWDVVPSKPDLADVFVVFAIQRATTGIGLYKVLCVV
jgi:hypothetical protein